MTKRMVLIGIDEYLGGFSRLDYCVADVTGMWYSFVFRGGVRPGDITALVNAEATKARNFAALRASVAATRPGDVLTLGRSSHGTRSYVYGDPNETDGYNEATCPHDVGAGAYETDDEYFEIFSAMPAGSLLEVFIDTCFAGTMLRSAGGGRLKERYLWPQARMRWGALKRPLLSARTLSRLPCDYVAWYACKEGQTSEESEALGHGVFTNYFIDNYAMDGTWYKKGRPWAAPRERIFERVRRQVENNGFRQEPMIEYSDKRLRDMPVLSF